jgi:hypothetical protein
MVLLHVVHKDGTCGNDNENFPFLYVTGTYLIFALNSLPVYTAQNFGDFSLNDI